MSLCEALLGRTALQARSYLEARQLPFRIQSYAAPRPDPHATVDRVVRVRDTGGVVELVTCTFREQIVDA